MGKLRFNYRSEVIGQYVDISVVLPTDGFCCPPTDALANKVHRAPVSGQKPVYQPGMKLQTVYIIHGGGDDDTLTYRYSNVEEAAQRNNVMLVTPNVANSFGINTAYGVPYMTFITEELPTVIQSLFASSCAREDNFIMGYAMGGNAALGCAVNRPDRYCACMDISGGIGMTMDTETLQKELEGEHFRNIFPLHNNAFGAAEDIPESPLDLAFQVKKHRKAGAPEVKYILACGSKEFIRERVERDVAKMQELEMDVRYICAEGYDHDFKMWDRYMQLGLDRLLPLKRKAVYPQ